MDLSEKALDYLEAHIPELAEVAFKQAYWAALASGSSAALMRHMSCDLMMINSAFITSCPMPTLPQLRLTSFVRS